MIMYIGLSLLTRLVSLEHKVKLMVNRFPPLAIDMR